MQVCNVLLNDSSFSNFDMQAAESEQSHFVGLCLQHHKQLPVLSRQEVQSVKSGSPPWTVGIPLTLLIDCWQCHVCCRSSPTVCTV